MCTPDLRDDGRFVNCTACVYLHVAETLLQPCTGTPMYLPGAVVMSAVLYWHYCVLAWSSGPVCRRACHPTRHSFSCSNSSGTVPHPPPSTGRKIPAKTRTIKFKVSFFLSHSVLSFVVLRRKRQNY